MATFTRCLTLRLAFDLWDCVSETAYLWACAVSEHAFIASVPSSLKGGKKTQRVRWRAGQFSLCFQLLPTFTLNVSLPAGRSSEVISTWREWRRSTLIHTLISSSVHSASDYTSTFEHRPRSSSCRSLTSQVLVVTQPHLQICPDFDDLLRRCSQKKTKIQISCRSDKKYIYCTRRIVCLICP